jgi:hypothetical protein
MIVGTKDGAHNTTESVFERYNVTKAADRKDALIRLGQYNSRQAKAANE